MSNNPNAVPEDALDPSKPDHWTVSMGVRLKTLNAFINSVAVTSHAIDPLRVLDVEMSNVNGLVSCVRTRYEAFSSVSKFSFNELARGILHGSQAVEPKLGSARDALNPEATDCWSEIARTRFSTLDAVINDVYNDNPKKALRILEAEFLNLCRMLSVVCWLRNGCRPVSRIPPEILARIFWFCGQDPTRSPEDRVRSLIDVSHVCHRWRETALAHAYLWGIVTSLALGEKWMAEMLRRAKEVPLMVHSSVPSSRPRPAKPLNLSMLLPLLSRIETLELSDHVDDLAGFLRLFVEPAPILESLSLTSKRALRVPQDLFASHTPRLRILQLSGLTISWASPILMNLTTLDLRLPQGLREQNSIPLTPQVFDTLERMPGLEVLRIHNCFLHFPPRRSIDEHIRPNPIDLPHLSEIELQGSSRACVVLTRSIRILPTTVLRLYLDADENNDGFAALYPVVRTVSGHSDNEKPWHGLSVSAWRGLDIKAWKSSRSTQQLQHPEGDVYIHIHYKFRHAQDLDPLCAIYGALCRLDLSTLSIDYPCDDQGGFALARYWLPLQCQQLQHIFLHDGIWVSRLIDALRPVETSSGDHTRRTTAVPFPRLRSLDLTYYYKNDLRGKMFRRELFQVLTKRKDLQAPLDSIRLKFCEGPLYDKLPWSVSRH